MIITIVICKNKMIKNDLSAWLDDSIDYVKKLIITQ